MLGTLKYRIERCQIFRLLSGATCSLICRSLYLLYVSFRHTMLLSLFYCQPSHKTESPTIYCNSVTQLLVRQLMYGRKIWTHVSTGYKNQLQAFYWSKRNSQANKIQAVATSLSNLYWEYR